ncbi:DUF1552 domain-containing protein [Rhodopirellula sp. MGV]|uniref:DUF1552 domain-containing protein n=1 Tax=Rhodopirellula sp. MGV TaxID=2023130 RepID=UPI000B96C8A0|nr:DUF1552 domain-containing protein [Rhodopirellula sp. MGV]OYP29949.1 hypothetical protein CGZ80_23280 [Rhodopirellula sp. MGV]PNY35074.1 DUF1552 domain-containing protein [Rhodopirellula baltica]
MSFLQNPTQPKRLDRRTLLRGTSAVLGLPLLEAMTPMARSAYASADSIERPVRMACVFFPNGVIVPDWTPIKGDSDDPRDWQCSKTLEPLAPMKDKINVFRNLTHDNGRGYKDGAGDHARCSGSFLTAARPLKTSGNIRLGVSVDQLAASQLTGKTRLPSIELGLEGSRNAGSCDSGYSCAYSSNISWRNETQPMPKETIPRLAFERLFGSGDASERREKNRVRRSILDVVRGDAKNLMKGLGKTDSRKMDEYFSGVREIEQRIEQSERDDLAALPDIEVPFGRVEQFREHARLMFDLMVLAFQTDSTRVATMMLDNAGGNRRYTEIGISDSHHGMSHHRNKEDLIEKLSKIDRYLVEQFAYFVEKLDATSDAGGSLLDQSMVLYGSGISDGNRHRHEDLPIVMAGGASGQIETGRYIDAGEECPMANLFLTMLDMMGTPAEAIGDSNGRLVI